ncbi:hypothetical protein J6590_090722 [Homalodisca vitripennis]|nr:hypothetical protein J6590_090722 [Homalodisca vitripennis]
MPLTHNKTHPLAVSRSSYVAAAASAEDSTTDENTLLIQPTHQETGSSHSDFVAELWNRFEERSPV